MAEAELEGALAVVRSQLADATRAAKCHTCGCLHKTVEALAGTAAGKSSLAESLKAARAVFRPKKYDCLGCAVCFPALAANAFAEAYPDVSEGLDLCPAEEPEVRAGWPVLPGDFQVLRFSAPVAVCTLASAALTEELARRAPSGLAIAGTLQTENLGIERIIRNVLGNPNVRFLVLCGDDSNRQVGHLAGQSFVALFENGIDDKGRIRGARGKRPILKNVSRDQVDAFLRQVELVSLLGEEDVDSLAARVTGLAARTPGPFEGAPAEVTVKPMEAAEPVRLVSDPAGYLVIYPDAVAARIAVEHYSNAGVLDAVVVGSTAPALYSEIIARGLISRLDHAAYLGRELARAELLLTEGRPYVQDRAPGGDPAEVAPAPGAAAKCGCGPSCSPGSAPGVSR